MRVTVRGMSEYQVRTRLYEPPEMVRRIVHPAATIVYDRSKPDGTPRKQLDVSRLHALGWRHRTSLGEGIEQTYNWFLENHANARGMTA